MREESQGGIGTNIKEEGEVLGEGETFFLVV